jgi:hypothetical protein
MQPAEVVLSLDRLEPLECFNRPVRNRTLALSLQTKKRRFARKTNHRLSLIIPADEPSNTGRLYRVTLLARYVLMIWLFWSA